MSKASVFLKLIVHLPISFLLPPFRLNEPTLLR
jgi:hypothetical protein